MTAIGIFCASSTGLDRRWLDLADATGKALAARGWTLVSGGGRVGMMGAVADGARAGGAQTVGVMTESLVAKESADTKADELIVVADMGSRKNQMIERSDAFVVLPGGLGTLDELFEVWTTAGLGLHHKPIVLLDPDGFYDGLMSWLAKAPFVRPEALEKVILERSIDAALDAIARRLSVVR
ncbi:TIGR00730 family Rossman fold protein [Actinoplanes sp. TBRC 11911]|uniref:LOG family protein n=1 Tax=Actinoplanes sp. TBRC 11911 TaxID=2729386 RepID=UPI00145E383F|nr:TIGR00730 family Rossman fold protein [Actinoplanes sp. TBRC 11911]NMO55344.1 TIGR00730 family Rossman fold protein [Actinoplanes sp. TBRC 11911]